MPTWEEKLSDRLDPQLAAEIDKFETEITLRKQGKLDEKVFAETRLRRGCYGQRYDNGHRHDGIRSQELRYSTDLTKGPDTLWDAPGMQRIKIPFGGLNPDQMDVLADLAEEYADGVLHVTTRQDFQYHFVHIDDTPAIMRRLGAVGITTREACGNSIRNVTACPLAGVCNTEAFDVVPYAKAMAKFMLGHPDAQDFGRKFKIAFSGCREEACGLVNMHDMGAIAVTRVENGKVRRGFEVYVGGGLGAVPHNAKLFDAVPSRRRTAADWRRRSPASLRGSAKRSSVIRARIKFLIAKLGVEEFKRLVLEERKTLPARRSLDRIPRTAHQYAEKPLKPPTFLNGQKRPEGFDAWYATNVYRQKQAGYVVASITLPLGDLSSWQMRELAGHRSTLQRRQRPHDRRAEHACSAGSAKPICRISIANSRASDWAHPAPEQSWMSRHAREPIPASSESLLRAGLAGELRTRLAAKSFTLDEAVKNLRIKISGCFNSCGQHHIADLGFYGDADQRRQSQGSSLPGGAGRQVAGQRGRLRLAARFACLPSESPKSSIASRTDTFGTREPDEIFQDFLKRIGKKDLRAMLEDLTKIPPYEVDPSFYSDWGDPREYTIGDMGVGECAGEVVSAGAVRSGGGGHAGVRGTAPPRQRGLCPSPTSSLTRRCFRRLCRWCARNRLKHGMTRTPRSRSSASDSLTRTSGETDTPAANLRSTCLVVTPRRQRSHSVDQAHRVVEEAQLFVDAVYRGHEILAERGAR